FLIEGVFGRADPIEHLAQTGPLTEKLARWAIQVEGQDNTVLVYLTDPPNRPLVRSKVRVPARFYKVWETRDTEGESQRFLVFVGHGAQVEGRSGQTSPLTPLFLIIIALVVAYYVLRKKLAVPETVEARRRHDPDRARVLEEADAEVDEDAPDLPEDPAEALGQLKQQHDLDESPDATDADEKP
ncbi:MAG: hypothetical protein R3336_09080, partial [Phycisphaeraceae bacterium]|nr:hypothetical protein [Phycisphaeraceae bacterium]